MPATRFSPSGPAGRHAGFTYIGLLLLIAFLGFSLAGTGVVWSKVQQRQKEKQLLFAGNQFREAIGRYYLNTPGGGEGGPAEDRGFAGRSAPAHEATLSAENLS